MMSTTEQDPLPSTHLEYDGSDERTSPSNTKARRGGGRYNKDTRGGMDEEFGSPPSSSSSDDSCSWWKAQALEWKRASLVFEEQVSDLQMHVRDLEKKLELERQKQAQSEAHSLDQEALLQEYAKEAEMAEERLVALEERAEQQQKEISRLLQERDATAHQHQEEVTALQQQTRQLTENWHVAEQRVAEKDQELKSLHVKHAVELQEAQDVLATTLQRRTEEFENELQMAVQASKTKLDETLGQLQAAEAANLAYRQELRRAQDLVKELQSVRTLTTTLEEELMLAAKRGLLLSLDTGEQRERNIEAGSMVDTTPAVADGGTATHDIRKVVETRAQPRVKERLGPISLREELLQQLHNQPLVADLLDMPLGPLVAARVEEGDDSSTMAPSAAEEFVSMHRTLPPGGLSPAARDAEDKDSFAVQPHVLPEPFSVPVPNTPGLPAASRDDLIPHSAPQLIPMSVCIEEEDSWALSFCALFADDDRSVATSAGNYEALQPAPCAKQVVAVAVQTDDATLPPLPIEATLASLATTTTTTTTQLVQRVGDLLLAVQRTLFLATGICLEEGLTSPSSPNADADPTAISLGVAAEAFFEVCQLLRGVCDQLLGGSLHSYVSSHAYLGPLASYASGISDAVSFAKSKPAEGSLISSPRCGRDSDKESVHTISLSNAPAAVDVEKSNLKVEDIVVPTALTQRADPTVSLSSTLQLLASVLLFATVVILGLGLWTTSDGSFGILRHTHRDAWLAEALNHSTKPPVYY